ncbi:ORF6N domain-containing protein [Algoriphagus confluentis]|uniref:KilA-N DNA-binding domain-containing protein n=1 Tax=Algoriphagus confluentis TaxID=1697556 RepID=A0ABQ6PI16_9BACT|nr:hypothetical protein Aconfl_01030 [Algoriphagus confluentis]
MSKDLLFSNQEIENRIFSIRGVQVMIDRDLAELYGVETKVLNQAVKRNLDRFPEEFRFQINKLEKDEQVTKCDRFQNLKHSTSNPFAFTEQGVAMLSAVLRSEIAVKVSIQIIKAFVAMRKLVQDNQLIISRLDKIEFKQLESDQKFEKIFKALENRGSVPSQGIFFDGQVFDAYELASRIIRSANTSIFLIDNYINESTLTHLAKKKQGVKVILLTKSISKQLELDIQKANEQYGDFESKLFEKSHDRFLIIDSQEIYHLGASLKDLGKRWFAFSRIEESSIKSIINSIPT